MAFIAPTNITDRKGHEFRIRTAEPDDAEALLAYIRPIAEETEFFVLEPDEFPLTVGEEREWIRDHMDHPGKLLLVAETQGRIIGSICFEAGPHRRIAHRGVLGVSVSKPWRGRGVGTALLQALLTWAASSRVIEKVSLEVFVTNHRAIQLYRSLGFVEQGRGVKEIRLGPGTYVDVVWMYRLVQHP